MSEKHTTVKDAVIAVSTAQFNDLLRESYNEAVKDALKAFEDADEQGEPKAKVSFSVTWNPNSPTPKVESRLSWSVRKVRDTEDTVDPNQLKMADIIGGIGDGKEAA